MTAETDNRWLLRERERDGEGQLEEQRDVKKVTAIRERDSGGQWKEWEQITREMVERLKRGSENNR